MDRWLGGLDGGGCVRAAGIANEGVDRCYDQDDTCDERHGNNPDVGAPVARKEGMVHRRFRRLQQGVGRFQCRTTRRLDRVSVTAAPPPMSNSAHTAL